MTYDDDGKLFKELFKVVCRECEGEATVHIEGSYHHSEQTFNTGQLTFGCPKCGPRKDLLLEP